MKSTPYLSHAVVAILLAGSFASAAIAQSSASMHSARAAHQSTASGTRVLLTGGCAEVNCDGVTRTSEFFDPAKTKFVAGPNMIDPRVAHSAVALSGDRVLVVGGWSGRETLSGAELFDPLRQQFKSVDSMRVARMDAATVTLDSSSVHIFGGATNTNRPTASVERFDVASMRFLPTASLQTARAHHSATAMSGGRVLVAGGLVSRNTATTSVEIFDVKQNTFVAAAALSEPRCKHAAVRLLDGRVMVIAGSSNCGPNLRLASTEIFDPVTGRWERGPTLQHPRYKIANSVVVTPEGRVMVAGDAREIEVWQPGAANFASLPTTMDTARAFSTASLLANGATLIAGGYDEATRPTAKSWSTQNRGR